MLLHPKPGAEAASALHHIRRPSLHVCDQRKLPKREAHRLRGQGPPVGPRASTHCQRDRFTQYDPVELYTLLQLHGVVI